MPGAAWGTLIIAALIIAITAVGLLRVIFHLRAISARPALESREAPAKAPPFPVDTDDWRRAVDEGPTEPPEREP